MAVIGYARVSTEDQDTALQRDALAAAGCERIFEDKASGMKADRIGLAEALKYLRGVDSFVVWRLDRLGRSMKRLIEVVTDLEARGIGFRALTENIDTTTPAGRLVFHVSVGLRSSSVTSSAREPAPGCGPHLSEAA